MLKESHWRLKIRAWGNGMEGGEKLLSFEVPRHVDVSANNSIVDQWNSLPKFRQG